MKPKNYWTRCKHCLSWIFEPTSSCPKCHKDIDRQLSNMTDEEVDILFDRNSTINSPQPKTIYKDRVLEILDKYRNSVGVKYAIEEIEKL